MRSTLIHQRNSLNSRLALLRLRVVVLRLRNKANFDPSQPRRPAGNPDGGRWTNSGGGRRVLETGPARLEGGNQERIFRDVSGDKPWSAYVQRRRSDGTLISTTVRSRTGSKIVSEAPRPGVERNTVTLRSGLRFTFENAGNQQQIFDSNGKLISSAIWTPDGPVALPILQSAFSDTRKPGRRLFSSPAQTVLDAAVELYNWWRSTRGPNEEAVFFFRADRLDSVKNEPPVWTSMVKREQAEEACPRYPLLQGITNRVSAAIDPNLFRNRGAYGTAVHMALKREIDLMQDPNLTTEVSILKSRLDASRYGLKDTVRIDVLENQNEGAVCVYDLKTGASYISRARLLEIYMNVREKYRRDTIIIIELRPKR